MEMETRKALAGRLTDKDPKFCDLADRLLNRSANVFGTQNFRYRIDTTPVYLLVRGLLVHACNGVFEFHFNYGKSKSEMNVAMSI